MTGKRIDIIEDLNKGIDMDQLAKKPKEKEEENRELRRETKQKDA